MSNMQLNVAVAHPPFRIGKTGTCILLKPEQVHHIYMYPRESVSARARQWGCIPRVATGRIRQVHLL